MPPTDRTQAVQTHPDPSKRADVFWSSGNRGGMHEGKMQFRSFPSLNEAIDFVRSQTAGTRTSLGYTIDTGDHSLEGAELNAILSGQDQP
ncbi:hypothetical protein [Aureimonas sp. AU4]|uniref:hypothetical protein n=1 Tax=Aureimonas sp. AU4 TaxID=1638163 RepID=UPI000ACC9F25|nr:hypothetical protein [Aureimonas sp. AU4]